MWLTRDAGWRWSPLNEGLITLNTTHLIQSPSDPAIFYLATGNGRHPLWRTPGAGIFRSTAGGESWEQLPSTVHPDFQYIQRLAVSPEDANIIHAATTAGILRSIDGGSTWQKAYVSHTLIDAIQPSLHDSNVLFATDRDRGVLRSTNGGETWDIVFDASGHNLRRMEVALAPSHSDVVYFAGEGSTSSPHRPILYRSGDLGNSWEKIEYTPESWPDLHYYNNTTLNSHTQYVFSLTVPPDDPSSVFFGSLGLVKLEMVKGNHPLSPKNIFTTRRALEFNLTSVPSLHIHPHPPSSPSSSPWIKWICDTLGGECLTTTEIAT